MEFNTYIAQQRDRPGPIGDLARAYGDDGVHEDTNGEPLEILMRWLHAIDAGPEAFQAAKDVWAEWRVFHGGAMESFLRKLGSAAPRR